MENFGLVKENHYRNNINFNGKQIDVDLRIEDYGNVEEINSSYLLLKILVENNKRIEKKIEEKINEKMENNYFENLKSKVLILKNTKFRHYYEDEDNLICVFGRVSELFSLKEDNEAEYLNQIEDSIEIEILEKGKDFIEDEILGLLIKDEDGMGYVGIIDLPDGKKSKFSLRYDEVENTKEDFEKTVQNGRKVLENINKIYEKIFDGYVEYTLEMAQDWWGDNSFEEEIIDSLEKSIGRENVEKLKNGELTEEVYRKLIFITDISVDVQEGLSVTAYDGGWIFSGHWIWLEGDIDGEFSDGDIFG